jgi:endonuclease/exonuclease/phosphatase family metal-dependent hydrolase
LPAFTYNSGKGKAKYIDFFLLWEFSKESIDKVFLGNDPSYTPTLSAIVSMPNQDIPSDHLPVTIHLRLPALK